MSQGANDATKSPLPILVGVDGSESAFEALKWAAQQARLVGTPILAVATWQYPKTYDWSELLPQEADFSSAAERVLKRSVDAVRAEDPSLTIEAKVFEGHPAMILVDLSHSASLVVVGSRGHGEFVGMLLGSVSAFLASHAHCPVVIVRGEEHSGQSGEPDVAPGTPADASD